MSRTLSYILGLLILASCANVVHEDETVDLDGGQNFEPKAWPESEYLVPFECADRVQISQGPHSEISHHGRAQYAYDFAVRANTKVMAANGGVVSMVRDDVRPGHRCFNGGDSDCAYDANYVLVDHGNGTSTLYLHLNRASVAVGDVVERGQEIGRSGSTGWSTGPHLHIQLQQNCGTWWCDSLPLSFAEAESATLSAGDRVSSQNGCFHAGDEA